MTRINAGIEPANLTNQHLMAEHREIKRIPNCIKKGRYNLQGIPNEFCLGTGHVKFFYNKLAYLLNRYERIYNECKKRGFNVTAYHQAWDDLPTELMGQYTPTIEAKKLIEERIAERLKK